MSTASSPLIFKIPLDKTEEMFTKKQLWDSLCEALKKQEEIIDILKRITEADDPRFHASECLKRNGWD